MSDRPHGAAYEREDGVFVIWAGSIGKCSRALWAAASGIDKIEPEEAIQRIFAEGHIHEEAVRAQLITDGTQVSEGQEEIELWVIKGKVLIHGYLDGLVEIEGERVWEGKALGKSSFDRWISGGFDNFPEYAWQISVYMHARGLPAYYTVKRRDDGLMDYTFIDSPLISLADIKKKAIGVYKTFKRGEMPDCDPERFFCDYWHLHDGDPGEEDETRMVPGDDADRLDALATEYLGIKEAQKDMKARLDEIRDNIIAHLDNDPLVRITPSGFKIKLTTKTRTSLDRAKLTAEKGREFIAPYLKETEYEELTIKGKGI